MSQSIPPTATVEFFDPERPIHAAVESGWLDLCGGPARLLGEPGWHLPTSCPISVRLQWNDLGVVRVLDESAPVPVEVTLADSERSKQLGEVPRAVQAALRANQGYPFATGLSIAVAHAVNPCSGILWREPLERCLNEAVARAIRHQEGTAEPVHLFDGPSGDPRGRLWAAIDTGYPAPSDSAHGERVAIAALMGYRVVAELAGLEIREVRRGLVAIDDGLWQGTPLNMPPSVWESTFRHRIPETISGESFLDVYGGINSSRFRIERGVDYPLRSALHYIVHEAARARLLRSLPWQAWDSAEARGALGELVYQSHAQADVLGMSVDPANLLVSLAMELGPSSGFFGARLTGHGGGGTVALLVDPDRPNLLDELCRLYEDEIGLGPSIIRLA